MLMQDREYGALGLAKIRTGSSDTPETIAAEEELKASWGGRCPPWGHTYYPAGNMLTFQGDDEGIEQLLKDSWPDAWLAIQPVLAQVNELTSDAWSTSEGAALVGVFFCCPNNTVTYLEETINKIHRPGQLGCTSS